MIRFARWAGRIAEAFMFEYRFARLDRLNEANRRLSEIQTTAEAKRQQAEADEDAQIEALIQRAERVAAIACGHVVPIPRKRGQA